MIRLVLALAVLLGAVAIVAAGTLPHPHMSRVLAGIGEPYRHTYDAWGVSWSLGILSVQAFVLFTIIEPGSYNRSWRRPLASAGALVAIAAFTVLLGGMHPSAPEIAHGQWTLAMIVVLAVLSPVEYFRARSR
jgi:hypothetical protein